MHCPVTPGGRDASPLSAPRERSATIAAQMIAALILSPFALAFVYACVQEYLRYRSEGRAHYGLVYDAETGTTHVTGITEGDSAYNPDEFDPNLHNADAFDVPREEAGAQVAGLTGEDNRQENRGTDR